MNGSPVVVAVARDGAHRFSKPTVDSITLVAGSGVEGDVHAGATVRHRSRVARDPTRPNLRQVHLIHAELFDELRGRGYDVEPGQLGENITTRGLALLALPSGTVLRLGQHAAVEVTGLRNPCDQINTFRPGLLNRVLYRDDGGRLVRLAGIMGVVRHGGAVRPGDQVTVELPAGPHQALEPV
jgi:MOSC domain-containing protein YiiM